MASSNMAYTKKSANLSFLMLLRNRLEHLILEGTLCPGEKLLPERELAKQFDVSRPSLREAYPKEAKGFFYLSPRRWYFVQHNSGKSFSDP